MSDNDNKAIEESAMKILSDEGVSWEAATESLRVLALSFAETQNIKTLTLLLTQLGKLKSAPRRGDETMQEVYELHLTSDSVESLGKSLRDLKEFLDLGD